MVCGTVSSPHFMTFTFVLWSEYTIYIAVHSPELVYLEEKEKEEGRGQDVSQRKADSDRSEDTIAV